MKDLAKYFECDGAATPATVMGMGNPAAPEGDNVGSGDTFDHQKRKRKKVKSGQETQEWPDDKGQGKANEGLLDDAFGLDDDDFGLGFDKLFEEFCKYCSYGAKLSKSEYEQFYNSFKISCKEFEGKHKPANVSLMKAFRGKEYTILTFYEKTNCGYGRGRAMYERGVEIRKFIKNPRPSAVQIAWDPRSNELVYNNGYETNHPTVLDTRTMESFIMSGDLWDKFMKR